MPRPKFLPRAAEEEDDQIVFVIACEGRRTERIYFQKLCADLREVRVEMLPPGKDNKSAPRYIVDRMNQFWRENDLEPTDRVWIVMDVDHYFTGGHFPDTHAALEDAKQQQYNVAISNPCIEI